MQQPTEILLIGNSNSDSKLLLDELRKGDFNATWLRFESEQQLSRALTSKQWNVFITYFVVSGFKEIDIIKNIRTLKPTLPCFVVSETGEEDFIVKAIKAGAVDFISKKRLNRLVPAIKQALAESCCLKNGDKIEDELTKSKARYSTLFKESPVPLWEENLSQVKKYLDALKDQGILNFREYFDNSMEEVKKCISLLKITDANKATLKLYHASEKSEILNFPSSIFGKEAYEVFKEQLISLAEGKTQFESELLTKTISGESKYVLFRLSVVSGYEKSLARVIVSTEDITAQKQAVRAKRESEMIFRALFEKNQAAILLLDVEDTNVPIVDANEAAVNYYGFSKADLLNKTIMDLNTLPPETVRKQMADERKLKKNIFEFQHLLASGEVRDVETYFGPIDAFGKKLVYVVVNDITDRKKTRQALAKSEEKHKETSLLLESLFNTIPDIIGIQDAQQRIIRYNAAGYKLLNKTPEQVAGKKCFELIGNRIPCAKCATTKTFESKKPEKIEKYVKSLNGWFDVRSYPVLDETGTIRMVIEHWRDITARKVAEKELKNSEQRYRSLAVDSPNPIAVHCNHKIEFVNRAAVELLGAKTKKSLIGQSVLKFIQKDYQRIVEKRIKSLYENRGKVPTMEEKFIRLDGSVIDVEVAAARINFKGKTASQVVFRDITYRKRADLIQNLIYNISNAVYTTNDVNELFKAIRSELGRIFETNNFYIAIYDHVSEIVSLPVFTEEVTNFKSFPDGKTLAAYVIENNQPILIKKKQIDELVKAGKVEIYGSHSKVWLGVPLTAKNETIGVIAVQSYTSETAYGREELEILKFASNQIGLSVERKLTDIEIKASLEEKIVLLKEIHHRVKNNLQVISSLLYLQSKYLTDDDSKAIFLESQNRVRSMSLVHEKLYQSENLAKINLRLYITDLVRHLFRTYQIDPNYIKMNLDIDNVSLDVSSAIPCGLIINELVSNSLKYAFPDQRDGEVAIKINSNNNDEQYNLVVKDNGIGIKNYLNAPTKKTLGLQLVDTLVDQLQGKMEINGVVGTEFKISFQKHKKAPK